MFYRGEYHCGIELDFWFIIGWNFISVMFAVFVIHTVEIVLQPFCRSFKGSASCVDIPPAHRRGLGGHANI